jgi:hypothetical protein
MGAWGTALFADDVACDVRDAYRDLLGEGHSGPQATRRLLRDFREEIRDHDDEPVFWLALAATQWQLGRLEDKVKAKALKLLESGTALKRWSERDVDGRTRQRKAALDKLQKQLKSIQPAEKKLRKPRQPFIDTVAWPVGGIFAYRLGSGKYVLFHVVDCRTYAPGGSYETVFAVLDWIGKRLISPERAQKLAFKNKRDEDRPTPLMLAISRNSDEDPTPERVRWLPVTRSPRQDMVLKRWFNGEHLFGGYGLATWGIDPKEKSLHIDARLKCEFGWE